MLALFARRLAVVVMCALGAHAQAVAGSMEWTRVSGFPSNNSCDFASAGAVQACVLAYYQASVSHGCSGAGGWTSATYSGPSLVAGTTYRIMFQIERSCGSPTGGPVYEFTHGCTAEVPIDWGSGLCAVPEPDECDSSLAGRQFWAQHSGLDAPGERCHSSSSCKAVKKSQVCSHPSVGDTCIVTYELTGDQCGGGESPHPEVDEEPAGENCISSNGQEFCMTGPSEKNCGYLNDEFVCLGSVEADGCAVGESGQRACGASAPVPPVPDDGNPGVAADPDMQLTINEGDTVNVYSSGTVAGSSRPPNPSGDNPHDGDDGSGTGSRGSSDEGLMCTGDDCEEGVGEGPGDPFDDLPCYAEGEGLKGAILACAQSAWTELNSAVMSSDFITLVTTLADSIPENYECPSWTFVAFGETYDFAESACSLIEQQRSMLQVFFLIFWSLAGLRILLTIPGGE